MRERHHPERESEDHRPRPEAAAPGTVLALQRTAGNAAVAARYGRGTVQRTALPSGEHAEAAGDAQTMTALAQAARSRVLARFEGPEHEEIGDVTGESIDIGNGVVLTWGQVVAIAGDEYEDLDDLKADTETPEGRARLRLRLEDDAVPGSVAATLPEPTAEQRATHTREWIALLLGNVNHFAGGGTAVETWRGHHERAVATALAAGLAGDADAMQAAYAEEAFGEHFLTDSFAAGHVRTPRADISTFYVEEFAPRVFDSFVDSLRTRLEASAVEQITEQSPGPTVGAGQVVHTAVSAALWAGIEAAGGREQIVEVFGLALSGAVSGALHDTDGAAGVAVSSQAHPEPWRALGDGGLNLDPVTREQVELAVMAAREDLSTAFDVGDKERLARVGLPEVPPALVHFAFDSSELQAAAAADLAVAQSYLRHHTDVQVELVGHTDPLGEDDYNVSLGLRRAEAVAAAILADGVDPAQLAASRSAGESQLASTEPKSYSRNRRAELLWSTRADGGPAVPGEIDLALAQQALAAAVGPPYTHVERFIPQAIDAVEHPTSSDQNAPVPDWHWDSMPPELQQAIAEWIRSHVGAEIEGVLSAPQLDDVHIPPPIGLTGLDLDLRGPARAIVTDMLADPIAFLSDAFGEAPPNECPPE